jgi:hypothetical protein
MLFTTLAIMRVASSAAVVAAIVGSASAFVGPACLGSSSFAQRYFKLHLLQERTQHARSDAVLCITGRQLANGMLVCIACYAPVPRLRCVDVEAKTALLLSIMSSAYMRLLFLNYDHPELLHQHLKHLQQLDLLWPTRLI